MRLIFYQLVGRELWCLGSRNISKQGKISVLECGLLVYFIWWGVNDG